MNGSYKGFVKTMLIVLTVLIIIVAGGLYYLGARYTNNPIAVYQDSYALSSDKTKSDVLDKASKTRFVSLAYHAKELKQKSGSYVGFCELPFVTGSGGYSKIDGLFCNESLNTYVISGSISFGNYLCVDDDDVIRKLDVNLSASETKCPTTAPAAP